MDYRDKYIRRLNTQAEFRKQREEELAKELQNDISFTQAKLKVMQEEMERLQQALNKGVEQ